MASPCGRAVRRRLPVLQENQGMWGNRLGWIISASILFALGMLYIILKLGQAPSPVSDLFRQNYVANLDVIKLPIDPDAIVPLNEPGDSSEMYAKAIDSYLAATRENASVYRKYMGADPEPECVALLLKATHIKGRPLAGKSATYLNYFYPSQDAQDDFAELNAIKGMVQLSYRRAFKLSETSPDEAMKYCESIFALGEKLFDERLNFHELFCGFGRMGDGATGMKKMAEKQNNKTLAGKLADFDAKRIDYYKGRVDFLYQFTAGVANDMNAENAANTNAKHAGDVFAMVKEAKDPMWRTEAALQLGRLRFNMGNEGRAYDQQIAIKVLKDVAEHDPNPNVRAAARNAHDLTVENYRISR